jgi:hypothetical protein
MVKFYNFMTMKCKKSFILTAIFIVAGLKALISQIYFNNMVYNRNTAYVEIMGGGRYWTANYEYLFKDFGVKQGARIGVGAFPNFLNVNRPLCFTAHAEYVNFWFSKYHHIEWGAGISYRYECYKKDIIEKSYSRISPTDSVLVIINHEYKSVTTGPILTGRLGYRYQDPDGGLVVRVGWTPLFFFMNREKVTFDGNQVSASILPFSTRLMYFGFSVGWNWF